MLFLLFATIGYAQAPVGDGAQGNAESVAEVSTDTMNIGLTVDLAPSLSLSFNNNFWYLDSGTTPAWQTYRGTVLGWNLPVFTTPFPSTGSYQTHVDCLDSGKSFKQFDSFTDADGVVHKVDPDGQDFIAGGGTSGLCSGIDHANYIANDGSGLTFNVNMTTGSTITTSSGTIIKPGSVTSSVTDTNGNVIAMAGGGTSSSTITNSFGVVVATFDTLSTSACSPTHNLVFTYPTSTGTSTATVYCTTQTLQTNFGFPSTSERSPVPVSLVDHIVLGDGSQYSFTYESQVAGTVSGRLASITYPNGSVTQYAYTGLHFGTRTDGTVYSMTRTTADGVWTFSRDTAGKITTVTSPAPANNVTVYTYANSVQPMYMVQKQVKQGSSSVLKTEVYCYNGNQVNCLTSSFVLPITQIDTYTTLAGMSSSSRVTKKLDTYGNVTETDAYDFGASSPTITTKFLNFGKSWNGSISSPAFSTIGNSVNDVPGQVESFDSAGSAVSNSFYSYDSKGNRLTFASWASGSITTGKYLTTSYLYDANGAVNKITDTNGNISTSVNTSCNNLLATSTTVWPVPNTFSLTSTTQWDCDGQKAVSVTGFDGQPSSSQYNDPLWRKTSSTDALSNYTTYSYTPTTTESIFSFNAGASVADNYTVIDPVALTSTVQGRKGPNSNWDTVVSTMFWDSTGRVSESSIACGTSKGGTCAWANTETHDALGRVLVTTKGLTGGVTVTNTYSGRDVLSLVGPAPTGEVIKQTRTEYDGLGRVKSVCRLSSATGSKPCGQDTTGTGFPVVYTYNAAGQIASIARSTLTQTQTRSFTYDVAGRVLTSTYPESGMLQSFYDVAPASPGAACAVSTYNGKLVKTYDANGNTTCYVYDGVGRTTSIVYSGPNTDGNNKYFVYDSATVNGVPMTGTQYRLAEAYTAPTANGTKVTDEGFSYDALGRMTDMYEYTLHSGNYYHTTATYFENGAVKTIGGIPGVSTFTYSIDGKGRPYSLLLNPSTAITNSTTYNARGQVLNVNLGLGDSDVYTYNAQTTNMTGFTFTIGATPKVLDGTPTWNGNGTLRKLVLTDTISTGAQTCNYGTSSVAGYDELGRLVSANCGGVWSQTFSYDGFNNLSKSGSSSWLPGYNQANNRYMLAGTSYDSNGSLLTDTFHTYTWNQNGNVKAVTDTGTTLTYDAMGRLVEKSVSGVFTQILYGPTGRLATMSGQTTTDYLIAMPGGGKYEQGGLLWHPDWLGSIRLVSDRTARTMVIERAYAPYGETYNQFGTSTSGTSFTGDLQDIVPGTYDTLNREENPAQGRWLSVDPAHANWNGYAYSTQPLNTTDPSGLRDGNDFSQHGLVDPGGPAGRGPLSRQVPDTWYFRLLEEAQYHADVAKNTWTTKTQGQNTLSYGFTRNTITEHADGSVTSVSTTITATFSTAKGNEGQFLGATTETTTSQIPANIGDPVKNTTTGPQALSYGQAVGAMGASKMADGAAAALPSFAAHFGNAVANDARDHPMKYVFAVGEVGLIFTPLPEGLAVIEGMHEVKAAVDAGLAAGDLSWELTGK